MAGEKKCRLRKSEGRKKQLNFREGGEGGRETEIMNMGRE